MPAKGELPPKRKIVDFRDAAHRVMRRKELLAEAAESVGNEKKAKQLRDQSITATNLIGASHEANME